MYELEKILYIGLSSPDSLFLIVLTNHLSALLKAVVVTW